MKPMFLPNLVRLVLTSPPRPTLQVSGAQPPSEAEDPFARYAPPLILTSSPFFGNLRTPKLEPLQLVELEENEHQVLNSLSCMDPNYAPETLSIAASQKVVFDSIDAVSLIKSIQDWDRLNSLGLAVATQDSSTVFCQQLLPLLTPTSNESTDAVYIETVPLSSFFCLELKTEGKIIGGSPFI